MSYALAGRPFGRGRLASCARWAGACGLVGLGLVLAGAIGADSPVGEDGVAVDHRLGPRADREDCFGAEAGARMVYSLSFTGEVRFNLHHHVGDETRYDVEPSRTPEAKAEITLPETGKYCLMYTNLGAGYAYVRGRYRLSPP